MKPSVYDFVEGQPMFQYYLAEPPFKKDEPAIISLWAHPEPLLKQTIVPNYSKKLQPPVVDLNLNSFQDQFNANQGDQEDRQLQLEEEDLPEADSTNNMTSRATSLLERIGKRAMGGRGHNFVTKEMHNLVKAVEKLSGGFKVDYRSRLTAGFRNPLRDTARTSDQKDQQRSKAPTRGSTIGTNENMADRGRSISIKTTRRSESKNKNFRVTNRSMAL